MVERKKVVPKTGATTRRKPAPRKSEPVASKRGNQSYFTEKQESVSYFSSGCTTLDCALGGGWAGARVINIVGNRAAGKTLLAIEAIANFEREYKGDCITRYMEAESAFDVGYANALGCPTDNIEFATEVGTVEDLYDDVTKTLEKCESQGVPCLYIVDSLDALSSNAERNRKMTDSNYGDGKAKMLSEFFRRTTKRMNKANFTLFVISQIRDKLDAAAFGKKVTRSGGKALDFYASQVVFLAEVAKIKKTVRGQMRPIGIDVKAKVEKNKVGIPYREVKYPIIFGFGVDDLTASTEWLASVIGWEDMKAEFGIAKATATKTLSGMRDNWDDETKKLAQDLSARVKEEWQALEKDFLPKSTKY